MIALGFLFICILATQSFSTIEENLIKTLFSERPLIIGWVAMWKPMNTFLYGWWPIVHKRNILQKIIDMDISIGTGYQVKEKNFSYRFTSKKDYKTSSFIKFTSRSKKSVTLSPKKSKYEFCRKAF